MLTTITANLINIINIINLKHCNRRVVLGEKKAQMVPREFDLAQETEVVPTLNS
jgi:hypothetical protein